MTDKPSGFDPGRYLTKVGSADYLEVKWRLVWLREVHPEAQISTELVSHDVQGRHAIFRANVSIPGAGSASGYGSEDYSGFREYIEKAETKAIGRALAALGFGTQFCNDFDFADGHDRVVDAPVQRQNVPQRAQGNGHNVVPMQPRPPQQSGNGQPTIQNPDGPPSDKQVQFLGRLLQEADWSGEHADEWLKPYGGRTLETMTKADASALIEYLKGRGRRPDIDQPQMFNQPTGTAGDDHRTR